MFGAIYDLGMELDPMTWPSFSLPETLKGLADFMLETDRADLQKMTTA